MKKYLVVLLAVFSCWGMAEGSKQEAGQVDMVSSYLNTTELGKNLQTLENYYSQINKQLDKQMRRNRRDPFEPLVESGVETEVGAKPRFIPREVLKESSVVGKAVGEMPMRKANVDLGGLPSMQFRGFLKSKGEKAGLLEIDGQGTFVVHEGDQVGLSRNNGEMVIRVVEINALNLIVEFGSIGAKVVVQ